MSVIGPRPTLRYQVEKYTERQRRRLDVLPGITDGRRSTAARRSPGTSGSSWTSGSRAPLAPHRCADPAAHAARALRRHLQGRIRWVEGLTSAGDCGPLHLRRTARGHRLGVCARRRDDGCDRCRPDGAGALHADAFALVPRIDSPGYVPTLAALVAEHEVKLVVPFTDLDQMLLAQSRAALAPALPLPSPRSPRWATSTRRTSRSRQAGSRPLPAGSPTRCRTMRATRSSSMSARASARATSTAPHDRTELDFFLRYTPSTRSYRTLCFRVRSSRSTCSATSKYLLNAIPRTMIQSKGGESIKGMTIKDRELIEFGDEVAETWASSARQTSSASASPTGPRRSPM